MSPDSLSAALADFPQLVERANAFIDGCGEIPRDPALVELLGENLRRALVDGGLDGQLALGLAIGKYLTERERDASVTLKTVSEISEKA